MSYNSIHTSGSSESISTSRSIASSLGEKPPPSSSKLIYQDTVTELPGLRAHHLEQLQELLNPHFLTLLIANINSIRISAHLLRSGHLDQSDFAQTIDAMAHRAEEQKQFLDKLQCLASFLQSPDEGDFES